MNSAPITIRTPALYDAGSSPRHVRSARARTRSIARAKRLATWLDRRFVDPVLGFLVPGLGDLVTSTAGLYIVYVGINAGLPPVVIARMMFNLALDTLIGAIPIVGDVFDFWFQANRRNVELLTDRHERGSATGSDWTFVIGAGALFIFALALPFIAAIALLKWIF